MKHLYFFALLLSLSANLFSQGWQKLIGSTNSQRAFDVIQTPDNGFLICGESNASGSYDVYLAKLDAAGNYLWGKTYGTTDNEYGKAIVSTSDGGYVISGSVGMTSGIKAILLKVDSDGNQMWCKYSSINNTDGKRVLQYGSDFAVSGGGGFGASLEDIGLLKYSSSGDVVTQIEIDLPSYITTYPTAMASTAAGGVAVSGYTSNVQSDIFILESLFGPNCSFLKIIKAPGGDVIKDMKATAGTGFVLVGRTNSFGAGGDDAYVLKLDGGGNVIWAKTYGSADYEEGESITLTSDGGYIFTSLIPNYTATLVKIDAAGDLQWASTYRSTDSRFLKVIQSNDGGYLAVGSVTEPSSFNTRIFVVKTNANGNSGCVQTTPSLTVGVANPGYESTPTSDVDPLIPATYTLSMQSGSGGSVTDLCIVNVEDQSIAPGIVIFPNPAADELHLRLPAHIPSATLRIFDLNGREMIEPVRCDNQSSISLAALRPGHYMISLSSVRGIQNVILQKQ